MIIAALFITLIILVFEVYNRFLPGTGAAVR